MADAHDPGSAKQQGRHDGRALRKRGPRNAGGSVPRRPRRAADLSFLPSLEASAQADEEDAESEIRTSVRSPDRPCPSALLYRVELAPYGCRLSVPCPPRPGRRRDGAAARASCGPKPLPPRLVLSHLLRGAILLAAFLTTVAASQSGLRAGLLAVAASRGAHAHEVRRRGSTSGATAADVSARAKVPLGARPKR